jgi:hypothetical protein
VDANTSIRDYCADPEVHFEDVVLSYALPEERDRLLLEAAQRICWAFNWPINDTELTEYYVRSKR